MSYTAHLADDAKPSTTLCGLPWEPWQEPDIPTDDEIGFDELDYSAKVTVRESDRARLIPDGATVHQCPACAKVARRLAESPVRSYPDAITDPLDPPTVGGTDVSRPL